MKQNIIFLAIFGLLLSCNRTDKEVADHGPSNSTQQNDPLDNRAERQMIIEELRRLQAIFAENDKEKMADMLSIPMSNSKLGIYIDNDDFNEQLQENNDQVTRRMFTTFYQDISEDLLIDQINQLFLELDIDKLLDQDRLKNEVIVKTAPCTQFYRVEIENNLVTLAVGSNSNNDYASETPTEDGIPANDSSVCEFVLWWVFTFDGKHLHFKEISGAG